MYKIFIFMLLSCFWLPTSLLAQESCNGILFGKIIDDHDGSPLAFASLHVLNSNRGTVADVNGNYELTGLCFGNQWLIVSHLACENDTLEIQINGRKEFDFRLEHHDLELLTVEIAGTSRKDVNANETVLGQDELREASGKGMAETLESLPGLSVIKTGSNIAKPVIGGFSGKRVLLMNQGVQMQNQNWGAEHAPEIDPFAASNYSVIKGAGSVQYGDGALGGIILIEPSALPSDTSIGGSLNTSFASNNRMGNGSLMLEGRFKKVPKLSWRAQGSLKKAGNVRTPDYYQKNTGVEEQNYSWMMSYRTAGFSALMTYSQFNSKIGIFSAAHIGNLTDLNEAINRDEPREEDASGFSYEIDRPYQLVAHELIKGDLKWYLASSGELKLSVTRQFNIREEFDKERPRDDALAALNIPEFSVSLESYTADLVWENENKLGLKTKIGLQGMVQENSLNSFTDFIPDYTAQQFSVFLVEEYQHDAWNFSIGLRQTQQGIQANKLIQREYVEKDHNYELTSVVLGFGRKFGPNWEAKLNASSSERAPAINELYSDGLHHGSASLEFGDPNLTEEKALGVSLQVLGTYEETKVEVNVNKEWIRDFIYLNPTGNELTIRGAFPSFEWKNTDAEIINFDGRIRQAFSRHWSIQYTWSLVWAENTATNSYLPFIPSNRMDGRIDYAFLMDRDSKEKAILSIGQKWVFEQTRFNPEVEIADAPPGYELLFANLQIPVISSKNKLNINLRVDNLLNVKYREYLNRFRYFTDEAGRDFRLSLQYKF